MVELMRALHNLGGGAWELLPGHNDNNLLAAERGSNWYRTHVRAAQRVPRTGRFTLSALRDEVALRHATSKGTVVHRTYHPIIDLVKRRTPVIETVHDMWDFVTTDEAGPRAAIRRRLKQRAIERADRIICVSQSTRDILANQWPNLADRTSVIHHGTSRLAEPDRRAVPSRPFFLFVGRRDRYKNFDLLLKALTLPGVDAELVCFGGGPMRNDEKQAIATAGLLKRVRQTDGDDSSLAAHYQAACALLYPSRHEGFGLPLLEAMALGCPVIAAPLTALPEVGGDAAFYADADSPEEWHDTMSRLLEDEELRRRAAAAGQSRAAHFSWHATARRHADIYQEMIN